MSVASTDCPTEQGDANDRHSPNLPNHTQGGGWPLEVAEEPEEMCLQHFQVISESRAKVRDTLL